MILMSYTHEELNASEASQGSSPMTTTKVSRLQKEGEGRKKKPERGLTCVIYVSRHKGFQPLIT